jgi:hypothetical protein
MARSLRILAILLVAVSASALPDLHALAFYEAGSGSTHPAAGCHHRLPVAPSKTPVSYQCCAGGHEAAIPNAVFSSPLPGNPVFVLQDGHFLPAHSLGTPSLVFSFVADSPPGVIALRV